VAIVGFDMRPICRIEDGGECTISLSAVSDLCALIGLRTVT
jgi:hypothetical protein